MFTVSLLILPSCRLLQNDSSSCLQPHAVAASLAWSSRAACQGSWSKWGRWRLLCFFWYPPGIALDKQNQQVALDFCCPPRQEPSWPLGRLPSRFFTCPQDFASAFTPAHASLHWVRWCGLPVADASGLVGPSSPSPV